MAIILLLIYVEIWLDSDYENDLVHFMKGYHKLLMKSHALFPGI